MTSVMRACRAAKCSLRLVRACWSGRSRADQSIAPSRRLDRHPPASLQLAGRRGHDAVGHRGRLSVDGVPDGVGERQESRDRRRHPLAAITVAEHPHHQGVGVTAVVGLLPPGPGHDGGDRRIGRCRQRLPTEVLGDVVQPVADEGVGPVGARALDEVAAAVGGRRPPERQGVDVVAEQLVQRGGMAELVLGDRAERQILLEEGRHADPLGVLLAHQVLVVGKRQQVLTSTVAEPRAHHPAHVSRWARRWSATSAPSLCRCGLSALGARNSGSTVTT